MFPLLPSASWLAVAATLLPGVTNAQYYKIDSDGMTHPLPQEHNCLWKDKTTMISDFRFVSLFADM
jgi:hypothetical protein